MQKKVSLCFLVIILIELNAFTQNQNWIQPTPNSYSFAKYGEIPVSLYTGIPDVSIPITSIKENDAESTVTLSYHGSGIKVDEIASWAGLGWNLNAGGCITRVINGQPEYPDPVTGLIKPTRNNLGFPVPENSDGRFDNLTMFQNAKLSSSDLEPDIFYFNFAGGSGKFIFDENGKAQMIKHQAWDVKFLPCYPGDPATSQQSKFIITTENGTKYEFGERDYVPYDGLGTWTVGAWYLTKITSPYGNEITFEYSSASTQQYSHSKTYTLVYASNMQIYADKDDPTPQYNMFEQEVFLTKIKTLNSGWIEFKQNKIPSNIRKDYYSQQNYPLDEIILYDGNNTAIKRIKLYTSYFIASNFVDGQFTAISSPWTSIQHLRYRLKLDSLKISSGDNLQSIPSYKFKYYNDLNASLYNLPYRLSPDQDHWGYFNNANNSWLIPQINWSVDASYWFDKLFSINNDPHYNRTGFIGGANRESDGEAMKACVLNKIYYPTGGYTEFNFEANDYYDYFESLNKYVGGIRIQSIKNYTSSSSLAKEKQYTYRNFDAITKQISANSSGYVSDHPKNYYVTPGKVICEQESSNSPQGDIKTELGNPSFSSCLYVGSGFTYNFVYKISALPQASLGNAYNDPIGYNTVVEKETGNGYSVNYFTGSDFPNAVDEDCFDLSLNTALIFQTQYSTSMSDGGWLQGGSLMHQQPVKCSEWPYLPPYEYDWKRGLLTNVCNYDNNNILISSQDNEYNYAILQIIPGYRVYSVDDTYGTNYIHGKYLLSSNWVSLKKKREYSYSANGTAVIITRYYYNNDSCHLLDKETVYTNGSDSIETKYTYPTSYYYGTTPTYNGEAYNFKLMVDRNMINIPVEKTSLKNSQVIGSELTLFDLKNNIIVPKESYSLEFTTPFAYPFTGLSYTTLGSNQVNFSKSNDYKLNEQYQDYDTKGNILQTTGRDGIVTSYLWDATGNYPMAQVKGATYSQISAQNGQTANFNSLTLRDSLNTLVPSAFIQTFSYKPLVGMTSQTDANGKTTYYEYDNFGRLKLIKDDQNKILKKFDYHYSNQ